MPGDHVVVVGGGVVGVTTAFEARRRGYTVTLVESNSQCALETSRANGSLVCPSLMKPWTGISLLPKVLSGLFVSDSIVRFDMNQVVNPRAYRWGLNWARACLPGRYDSNMAKLARLSYYSASKLRQSVDNDSQLRGLCNFAFGGSMQLYADRASALANIRASQPVMDAGVALQPLTQQEILTREPALAGYAATADYTAVYSPHDFTGDCFKFTQEILRRATGVGVAVLFNTRVTRIVVDADSNQVSGVDLKDSTGKRFVAADHVVVCCGNHSPDVLETVGITCPVLPVKGYSVTFRAGPGTNMHLTGNVVDDARKLYIAPLGQMIRVTGLAEFVGFDATIDKKRANLLVEATRSILPNGMVTSVTDINCCFRPMTPDDVPIISGTSVGSLWVNTGHGSKGWTHSVGSAELMVDLISSKPHPCLDPADYSIQRFL